MPPLNPPLTKDDFTNSHWQEVVNSSERKDCLSYDDAFWKKAQEAQAAGNVREQAVFEILAAITSAAIKPESPEEFFSDIFRNLTEEHLNFLAEIATEISDPELQARVADVLWSRRRNYQMAQLAVTAYLQSAAELEDPEQWSLCFERIERALRLARRINYQVEAVMTHIEAVLDRYNGEDRLWLSAKLMELLQSERLGNPTKYAAKYAVLAEKAATLAESSHDWDRARTYWNIKARWHLIEKDSEKERAASMLEAETYVQEAEDAFQRSPTPYSTASRYLQKAVEAFRSIRGTKEETVDAKSRSEEIHNQLVQYQGESVKELIPISQEFDISKEVEIARSYVSGKHFEDAIFALALLGDPPQRLYLRQEVQKRSGLSHISPIVMMNEMGKAVARQPSDPDDEKAATCFEMYKLAVEYQRLHAQAFIEPARYQVNLEHSVRTDDFLPIVSHSPFVPQGREYLFAKGLYAGLNGDFFTSTHILIPQIENSVRYLLAQRGVRTSGLDRGIQNEHYLTSTLYPQSYPDIISIFDEDTLFDLQGLLVEHSGSNLRNRMAHGLINDDEFLSPVISYLWWLALRLCWLPILNYQHKVEQSNPWIKFAGMFKDDPLFDEFVEDMATYRRELDAEMIASQSTSEEN